MHKWSLSLHLSFIELIPCVKGFFTHMLEHSRNAMAFVLLPGLPSANHGLATLRIDDASSF